jgi:glyoxylase-like metal-dependent hydrolase (beta-lactamase superfamily II)
MRLEFAVVTVLLSLVWGCANSTSTQQVGSMRITTLRVDYSNVHVIERDDDRLVLIDSGAESSVSELTSRLRGAGFEPGDIEAVILTHGHADHAGGARHFRQTHGTRVLAGVGDKTMLETGENDRLCPTSGMAERRREDDQAATYTPTDVDQWIGESTSLDAVKLDGRIVPVAGHTDGSLVIVLGKAAFVGDLFRGSIVGRRAETHFYMCDLADNRRDIRQLLDSYPDVEVFFTGHFGPVRRAEVEAFIEE